MPLLLTLLACGNPCQQLCGELYDYAKECGHDPSQDELQACNESFSQLDDATAASCRESNDPDYVREWWSCEDLAENWSNVAP